jgi:hypothetical protein
MKRIGRAINTEIPFAMGILLQKKYTFPYGQTLPDLLLPSASRYD